jgi:hypothetical protein
MKPRCYLSEASLRMWLRPLLRRGNPNRLYTGGGTGEPPERLGYPFLDAVGIRNDSWALGFPASLTDAQMKEGFDLYLAEWALVIFYSARRVGGPEPWRSILFIEPNIEWPTITNDDIQQACMADDLITLAQIPSRRPPKPGKERTTYTVKQNPETSALSCDCLGFILSKREPASCRHTLVFEKLLSDDPIRPGDNIPIAPARPASAATMAQRTAAAQLPTPTTLPKGPRTDPRAAYGEAQRAVVQALKPTPTDAPNEWPNGGPQVGQIWTYRFRNRDDLVIITRVFGTSWVRLATIDPQTGYIIEQNGNPVTRTRNFERFRQLGRFEYESVEIYRRQNGISGIEAPTGEEVLARMAAQPKRAPDMRPVKLRTLKGDRAPAFDPLPQAAPTRQIDFDDD